MAEDKKPKIDLKARLGKAAAPTPTPAPVGSVPVPASVAPVGISGPGLPVPPGVPIGSAPVMDPSNPLAAVASARPMSVPVPQHHHQTQRIEVDEMAVQQAAARARKTGMVFALIALLLGVGAGFVGGQAKEAGDGRAQARKDAGELKTAVDACNGKVKEMADKVKAGAKLLTQKEGKQFPKELANQLGGITPAFDGSLLAQRRFSGFPKDTSKLLFDYVTNITALNEHKTAIKNLLTKLEKPVSEQFAASAAGQHAIQYVVLLGGTSGKDGAGNYVGNLAQLNPVLSFTGDNPPIPNEIKANYSGQSVSVSKYRGGSLAEPAAIYVTPGSFDAVCPAETKSVVAQLAVKLGDLILEMEGEGKPADDVIVQDKKLGLVDQADLLSKGLDAVANGK